MNDVMTDNLFAQIQNTAISYFCQRLSLSNFGKFVLCVNFIKNHKISSDLLCKVCYTEVTAKEVALPLLFSP